MWEFSKKLETIFRINFPNISIEISRNFSNQEIYIYFHEILKKLYGRLEKFGKKCWGISHGTYRNLSKL